MMRIPGRCAFSWLQSRGQWYPERVGVKFSVLKTVESGPEVAGVLCPARGRFDFLLGARSSDSLAITERSGTKEAGGVEIAYQPTIRFRQRRLVIVYLRSRRRQNVI